MTENVNVGGKVLMEKRVNIWRMLLIAFFAFFVFALVAYFFILRSHQSSKEILQRDNKETPPNEIQTQEHRPSPDNQNQGNDRYYESLIRNNPAILQDAFVEAVKNQVHDEQSKTDAYFIFRRYMDNGGNIYEITDYIDRYPELSFLKEAKEIFPGEYQAVQERRVPFTYSDQAISVFLAYLEILEKHGYANLATISTAAGQYAKLAYYKTSIREEKSFGHLPQYPDYSSAEVGFDIAKAQYFLDKADPLVTEVTQKDSGVLKEWQPLDTVFGLEQFGSALRYLAAVQRQKWSMNEYVRADTAYNLAVGHSYKNAPELYLLMTLSNATTLLLSGSPNAFQLRNAVYPFFDIRDPRQKESGIVEKIIRSRIERPVSEFQNLSPTSRKNIVRLGETVPEFKSWLLSNGWKEEDFQS